MEVNNSINGVQVPVAADLSSTTGLARKATVKLEWKTVNEPIDEKTFEAAGLGVPDGTLTVNHKLGPPIIESVLGNGAREPLELPAKHSRLRLIVLVGANLAMIAALLIVFYKRRRTT